MKKLIIALGIFVLMTGMFGCGRHTYVSGSVGTGYYGGGYYGGYPYYSYPRYNRGYYPYRSYGGYHPYRSYGGNWGGAHGGYWHDGHHR